MENISIKSIPASFVINNLTEYQAKSIEIKWFVKDFIDSYDGSIIKACGQLEELLSMDRRSIQNIYYGTNSH